MATTFSGDSWNSIRQRSVSTFFKGILDKGAGKCRRRILCNNFSSWFSTYVLSIAFEGLCWVWFMRLCLNRMLQKPNDFRFINSKIKWKIYCTRKEFPRAKVIIQSARLPLSNANFDEWKHQRQQQQKNSNMHAPFIVKVSLICTWVDEMSELTLLRLSFIHCHVKYIFQQKNAHVSQTKWKKFSFSALSPLAFGITRRWRDKKWMEKAIRVE